MYYNICNHEIFLLHTISTYKNFKLLHLTHTHTHINEIILAFDILCQMNGLVSGLILVIISIDLFLFIVKAAHHHKIMTCKVTFGIIITI